MNMQPSIKAFLDALFGLTLLAMILPTAIAQSPIFPFPSEAPAALSAQPFLQQNQVVVGKASVSQIAPAQITPAQRNYAAPVITNAPIASSAPVTGPLQIVLSENELFSMDLKKEMAYQSRIQRQVQSTRDINSFSSIMIQNLGQHGWSTSWQGVRSSTGAMLTDLYQTGLYSGGEHLRLEVKHSTTGGYEVLLYKF